MGLWWLQYCWLNVTTPGLQNCLVTWEHRLRSSAECVWYVFVHSIIYNTYVYVCVFLCMPYLHTLYTHCIHTLGWLSNFASDRWSVHQEAKFRLCWILTRCLYWAQGWPGHICWPQTREKSIARFVLWPFQMCIFTVSLVLCPLQHD